jgi:hypothetical protein
VPESHDSHDACSSIDAVVKMVLRLSEEKTPDAWSLKHRGADVGELREKPKRRVEIALQKLRAHPVLPPPLCGLPEVRSGRSKKDNAMPHHPRRI